MSYLFEANMQNTNLANAQLIKANLRAANLTGADLREANLQGADLREASYNSDTKFPDDFDPEASGMALKE